MNSIFIVRLIRLSFPIIIIGVLFKIMHWSYSQALMTIGLGMIVLLYPIRFYFKKNKRLIDYVKLAVAICLPINYYLTVFHLPSFFLLPIVSLCIFIFWLILEVVDKYSRTPTKDFKVIPFGIASTLMLLVLAGAFFKLWHYPYGNLILIIGFSFLAIYFLIDTFKIKE